MVTNSVNKDTLPEEPQRMRVVGDQLVGWALCNRDDGNVVAYTDYQVLRQHAAHLQEQTVTTQASLEEANTDCPLCGSAKTMLMAHCRDCGGEWAGGQMLSHNACVSAKATAARLQAELEEAKKEAYRLGWEARGKRDEEVCRKAVMFSSAPPDHDVAEKCAAAIGREGK